MAAAGAHILGCSGPVLTADERAFFAEAQPFGFILFDRNIEDAAQIRALTAALRDAVGRAAPILIDQEGGRVQRLRPPLARDWPPALDHLAMAAPGDRLRLMWLRYRIIAAELVALGIDVNCAPLADIATATTHPILRNRCYGETLAEVAPVARAVAGGLAAGGVLPVLKHIPGHGRGTLDSHLELPHVDTPAPVLSETDFAAFKALADLPLGMTAHIVYDALDPSAPATTSPVMIRLIREDIGFTGLLMTDDISMEALSGSIADRSAASIRAGCDLVLHCNGDLAEMQAVAGAAGPLDGAAATRAAAAMAARRPPDPIDIHAAEAELADLTGAAGHV